MMIRHSDALLKAAKAFLLALDAFERVRKGTDHIEAMRIAAELNRTEEELRRVVQEIERAP